MRPPEWAIRTAADQRAIEQGYYWDEEQADRVIRFVEKYVAPRFTVGEFCLFDWQRRFLQTLYGWRRPDGGRRFTKAVLHVPKKNGKTLLVSALSAYELFAVRVPFPLVMSASTTKKNARQVFEQLKTMIGRSKRLQAIAKIKDGEKIIQVARRSAEYHALSSDAPSAEGENLSFVVVDEAHAHRSPKLYRALEYSMIGREDGLMVVISTAGDDLTHFYYGLVERGRRVLKGEDLDPTFYAEIYEADPEKDDLDDPAVWQRVNPSLDQYPGFTSERFRLDYEAAKKDTGDRLNFERYRLNIFRRAEDGGWIDILIWDRGRTQFQIADLVGLPCWLGFDGSQTTDPTSITGTWLLPPDLIPGKRYAMSSWSWVSEEGVRRREKSNLPRYQQYAADGWLTVTSGDLIDRVLLRDFIHQLRDSGQDIREIIMDLTLFAVFGSELEVDGFEVYRQPQTIAAFADSVKGFEEAVIAGQIAHDGNEWLRWCLHSVRLLVDLDGRGRPARRKSVDKIDGAVAGLMSFGRAMLATAPQREEDSGGVVFI